MDKIGEGVKRKNWGRLMQFYHKSGKITLTVPPIYSFKTGFFKSRLKGFTFLFKDYSI